MAPELVRDDSATVAELMKNPAFEYARGLLGQEMVFNIGGDEITGEIIETEAFGSLEQDRHVTDFDGVNPKLEEGQVFVTWYRGRPNVNVVVDPEKRSVVCIKRIRADKKRAVSALLGGLLEPKNESPYDGDTAKYEKEQSVMLNGKDINDPTSIVSVREGEETSANVVNKFKLTTGRAVNSIALLEAV